MSAVVRGRPTVGGRSPWGKVQEVVDLAPGVWQVHTAGHGGIKLARERQAELPKEARAARGWYEEDVEACVPLLVWAEELGAPAKRRESWRFALGRYHPDVLRALVDARLVPGGAP